MSLKIKSLTTIILATLVACGSPSQKQGYKVLDSEADAQKAAWLEKAAQALRNGEGLSDNDDFDQLMAMDKAEVVKRFMADSRFGDTMLAFNLFYLGRGVNTLKKPDMTGGFSGKFVYDPMAFAMPQALASARAMVDGGDYYDIYGAAPALFVAPLKPVNGVFEGATTDAEKRAKILDGLMKNFDGAIAAMGAESALNKQEGCNAYGNFYYQIQYTVQNAGFDPRVGQLVGENWTNPIFEYPNGDCYSEAATGEQLRKKLVAIQGGLKALFAAAETLPQGTGVSTLGELAKVNVQAEGLPSLSAPLTSQGFWGILRNSSTNYNRKRAAYMLRTYFCDDLTPLAVEVATDHAQGAHATDPACQSCHYKLDPMGGLFRYHGQNGMNFEGSAQFTYDDFKTISDGEFKDYLKGWQDDQGKWKTGYFVGANKAHKKWKGDKLADMWTFLPQASEAKQCLVRRMAEYFLGPDQVYDGGWLEAISENLEPGVGSSAQVKKIVTSLVTSKTFSHSNPELGKCYDFASGEETSSEDERAPCEISHVVKKRCANCHSDATENGIDFTKWTKLADGAFGFEHLNENGEKRTRAESFKIIIERITSTDPQLRMPKGPAMPEMERQILYKWLEKNGGAN